MIGRFLRSAGRSCPVDSEKPATETGTGEMSQLQLDFLPIRFSQNLIFLCKALYISNSLSFVLPKARKSNGFVYSISRQYTYTYTLTLIVHPVNNDVHTRRAMFFRRLLVPRGLRKPI